MNKTQTQMDDSSLSIKIVEELRLHKKLLESTAQTHEVDFVRKNLSKRAENVGKLIIQAEDFFQRL